jgi:protein-S-isoprenylcysteine O-methyltransferase Ste14
MFKASAFEYRFRYALHTVIFLLGFTAPWNYALHVDPTGPNAHLWGILAANMARLGVGSIGTAFDVLLAVGIVCALAGALLRTWGAAYLGASVVQSSQMHTAQAGVPTGILQDGPFRYVRNPLYLGTFLHTLALSLLMPESGAIFCIVAIGVLQIRLILAEEPFLSARLGMPYTVYCAMVPRIVPLPRTKVVAAGLKARWPQAFLGEIYMWGVAVSFAAAGWRYNAGLLTQCVLVSLGVSLLARAVVPGGNPATAAA